MTLDFIYVNGIKSYFSHQITRVQQSPIKINYLGMGLSYLLLLIGLNYFIIKPHKSEKDAFLLGIIIYGVYESTNYALFTEWSWLTVVVDTLWGGLLFGVTTYISNLVR